MNIDELNREFADTDVSFIALGTCSIAGNKFGAVFRSPGAINETGEALVRLSECNGLFSGFFGYEVNFEHFKVFLLRHIALAYGIAKDATECARALRMQPPEFHLNEGTLTISIGSVEISADHLPDPIFHCVNDSEEYATLNAAITDARRMLMNELKIVRRDYNSLAALLGERTISIPRDSK